MLNSNDSQYLVDYAVKNLWANSRLENNYIYKPKKITTDLPRIKYYQQQGMSLSLPDDSSRWHLYLLGALSDRHLGITSGPFVGWVSLDTLMTHDNYIVTIYQNDGLQYPTSLCYITRRPDGMVVLAVYADNYPNLLLGESDIYFQVYRNRISDINVSGQYINTEPQRISWLNALRAEQAKSGYTLINKNGYFCLDVNASDVNIGDYVEYTYDSSVLYLNSYTLLDLESFESTENRSRYYLVMNWDEVSGNPEFHLHYRNDTQFFVGDRNNSQGRLMHRNDPKSIYQLTHQDLALRVSDVDFYLNQLENENNATAKLISIVRDDGQDQRLEGDASRIYELYLMDKETIASNILGKTASVTEWGANELLNNDYNTMLKTDYAFLTGDLIYNCLGYYAADNILNRTPVGLSSVNSGLLNLTPTQRKSVTCLEYKDGLLNNVQLRENVNTLTVEPDSNLFELRSGKPHTGTIDEFEYYNVKSLSLKDDRWYRFYKGKIDVLLGKATEWVEVTETDGDYTLVDGEFEWSVDYSIYETKIKDSYYSAQYTALFDDTSDTWVKLNYGLGFGEIIAIVNNHSLVEGIDYLVSFPYIAFTGKKIYTLTENKDVYLFLKGFPNNPNEINSNKEVGFVKYGTISFDNHYALKDWRNYRISVNGKVYSLDDLDFGEDLTIGAGDFVNGTPYEWLTPVTSLANRDDETYVETKQNEDVDLDNRVINYLNTNKPQVEFETPSTYPNHYIVFSTFTNAVIKAFKSGTLSFTYSDIARVSLDVLLADYLYLLPLDVCVNDSSIDWEIVVVEPHQYTTPMVVSPDLYQILNAINNHYLNNRVSLVRLLQVA